MKTLKDSGLEKARKLVEKILNESTGSTCIGGAEGMPIVVSWQHRPDLKDKVVMPEGAADGERQ